MLESKDARLSGWVYVDVHGRALSNAVHEKQGAVASAVRLPPRCSISWSGQTQAIQEGAAQRIRPDLSPDFEVDLELE